MKLNSNVIPVLALIVATLSAMFTFVQYRTAAAQLRLNEQQLRPYVKYLPFFQSTKNSLSIDLALENYSPIPAKVLHTELTAWIDGKHVGFDLHSMSPDMLYQHKGALQSIAPINGALFRAIQSTKSQLAMGLCVVYTTSSKGDQRVWLHKAVYEYLPGENLPLTRYIDEEEVGSTIAKCSAKDVEPYVRQR